MCEEELPRQCKEKKVKEPELLEDPDALKTKKCEISLPNDYKDKEFFKLGAVNPLEDERAKCLDDCHVKPLVSLLWECERRVFKKILYTAENCQEETVNMMEAVDKCVKGKAFRRLV